MFKFSLVFIGFILALFGVFSFISANAQVEPVVEDELTYEIALSSDDPVLIEKYNNKIDSIYIHPPYFEEEKTVDDLKLEIDRLNYLVSKYAKSYYSSN